MLTSGEGEGVTGGKGGLQALGKESARNRKDLVWSLSGAPFPLDPSELRRDSSGNGQRREPMTHLNSNGGQENVEPFGC